MTMYQIAELNLVSSNNISMIVTKATKARSCLEMEELIKAIHQVLDA